MAYYRTRRPTDRRKIKSGDSAALLEALVNACRNYVIRTHGYYEAEAEGIDINHTKVMAINAWRTAISTLMERTCSVIGEDTIPVEWVLPTKAHGDSIAFTDGETIYFGLKWFLANFTGPLWEKNIEGTADAWADIKAVAYHELAHVLYTPRRNHRPTKTFRNDANLFRVFNILEDLRIESLFVTRYAPAKPIFINAVLRHVVDWSVDRDLRGLASAWVFTWGRAYLPLEVHHACANGFDAYLASIGTTHTRADFERVVGAYRKCVFPTDADRAIELVREFASMLDDIGLGTLAPTSGNHDDHKEGRADPVSETKETSDEMEDPVSIPVPSDDDSADEDDDDGAGLGADSESDADEADDDGAGGESGDGEDEGFDAGENPFASDDPLAGGDAGSPGSSSDADGDAGADVDGDTDVASSGGGHSDPGGLYDRLRDAVLSARDEVEPTISDDVRKSIKAATVITHKAVAVPTFNDTIGNKSFPVESWMRAAASGLVTEISRIFSDADEAWVGGHSSGRLNVADVMDARGRHFDVFDVYEDNIEEATSFEVVVLLDRSDSMAIMPFARLSESGEYVYGTETIMTSAAKATWVLKSALAELGIPATVIGYASDASMVSHHATHFSKGEYIVPNTRGGTHPEEAMPWASTLLKRSDAHNKLLISVTDGDWHVDSDLRDSLRSVRASGVKTLMIGIGSVRPRKVDGLPYGHDEFVSLSSDELRRLPHEVGRRIAKLASEHSTV